MLRLMVIFIIVPLIELLIIIKIGNELGFWPALALVVIPGLLGAVMARSQGKAVFSRVKSEIAKGRLPGVQIIDGMLIFFGGVLLITPGVVTDLLGLTVLLPGVRKLYRDCLINSFWRLVAAKSLRLHMKKPPF